jgi:endo-1,4-beta-D-glucanase Y
MAARWGIKGRVQIHRSLSRHGWAVDLAATSLVAFLAAVFTGLNMFHFPQFESDEGTYMGSAWAMFNGGALSYYTYNYDHPPFGWFLIGGWASLVGGFLAFGTAVATGRVFMWIVTILSTILIYAIVRRATGRRGPAVLSATLFAVSPLAVDLHRQVWLDNIATLWLLFSIYVLLQAKGSMTRILISATLFGLSFWTKEIMAIFLPGMAAFAFAQAHPANRRFASALWAATAMSVMSFFVLLALLKDELLPPGTLWSSSAPHVSLFDTYAWQLSRRGGPFLDPNSDFARNVAQWANLDPVVVFGGLAAALVGLLFFRRNPVLGGMSFLALSFVVFLGRGGQVLFYYVIPLVALFVVVVGLVLGQLANARQLRRRASGPLTAVMLVISLIVTVGAADADASGSTFTGNRTDAQREAARWILDSLPRESIILMDSYAWVDVREASTTGGRPFVNAHYYWPGVSDPAVRLGLLHDDWRNIDYLAFSPSIQADVERRLLPLVPDALQNADTIAHFQSQDWTVDIMRIRKFQQLEANEDPMLVRAWQSYKDRFIEDGRIVNPKDDRVTTSEGQAYALLQAVYMDDRATFDQVWSWTKTHLQVRDDGLLAWRWGKRVPPVQDPNAPDPSPTYRNELFALAAKWSAFYLTRQPTNPEQEWLASNRIPATDEHVSAFYEQTRDGTVWSADPSTYRSLRQRMQRIWDALTTTESMPQALVAHAIAEGWNSDRVRRAFVSFRTGSGPSLLPSSPLTVLDWNSATDADEDVSLALLFASRQWDSQAYRDDALEIIRGIWDQETTLAGGRQVLVAGNWARGDWSSELSRPVVNPSYFAPYAYRIFGEVDPAHRWQDLIDSSYDVLARIATTPALGGAAGLVPNWLELDQKTGKALPADVLGPRAQEFSYDASRIYWRLALDWLWFKDDRARRAIEQLSFPRVQLQNGGLLLAGYNLDGTPAVEHDAISMYAATLPGLLFAEDKTLVHRIFSERILRLFVNDPRYPHWGDDAEDYFNQNWAWFAAALMDGAITNVWASQPPMRLAELLP